ncbi:MAG: molybdopterin-guanine dinucleotide biosynthesis protein B [Planctomycetes bacterium]|nr:molybdopterin-guanine dinucleotide biosynthesis protein B [Planctomycetota bacterium]
MRRVHLVGYSGHGKTTLAVALIAHWSASGLRVGSIKHTGHIHELDTPGKDSWRQRQAGAHPAAIIAGDRLALHLPLQPTDAPYAILAPHYADCALVLVEGDVDAIAPKVEVWRAGLGTPPLATGRTDISAIITDDQPGTAIPRWSREDLPAIAMQLLRLAGTAC